MLKKTRKITALCMVVLFAATSLGFADDTVTTTDSAGSTELMAETSEAVETPEVAGIPDADEILDVAGTSDVTEDPDAVETPDAIEAPDVFEEPDAIEEQETIEEPEATEETDVIEEPEAVEEQEVVEDDDSEVTVNAASSLPSKLQDKSIYYLGDSVPGHLCLVASNTYMLRRMAIIQNSPTWSLITLWAIKAKGIKYKEYRYAHNGYVYHVNKYKQFDDLSIAGVKEQLIRLLNGRPEGVVIFGQHSQDYDEAAGKASDHGILITSYSNGTFYGIDPAHNRNGKSKGIEKLSNTSIVTLKGVTHYMCIQDIVYDPSTIPAPTVSSLTIKDYSYPKTLTQGQMFTVKGNVLSNCKISKVTVSIVNSKGNAVISKSASPNATSYNLLKIDESVKFGTLAVGSFTYKVTATDAQKTKTLVSKKFTVDPASTLAIKKAKYPKKLKKGKSFKIKGKISSNYKIKKITVAVYTKEGKVKTSVTKTPYAKSYNLKKISKKIKFKKLKKGTYYYKVTATDSKKTKVLLNKKFKVK